ncbi:hypothetical protein NDU88_009275 [Pleurodeles waltl]|uniref:Uncharacterized protein n=1 Tax=Pleurodeles waltl TaxID=8319 RepID=A0AAV7P1H9_PLEWA|nr:hypothetical protein NDU88_009275 [Pleurodeles waltl]
MIQLSLTTIDENIGSLPYRMGRLREQIDKHADRLNAVDQQASDIKDDRAASAEAQRRLEKTVLVVQARAEDLEGHFRLNNLCIIGLVESIDIGNMGTFVECLLINLLSHKTLSELFVRS